MKLREDLFLSKYQTLRGNENTCDSFNMKEDFFFGKQLAIALKGLSKYQIVRANEQICDALDVKEGLFCEEKLATVLKDIPNIKQFVVTKKISMPWM